MNNPSVYYDKQSPNSKRKEFSHWYSANITSTNIAQQPIVDLTIHEVKGQFHFAENVGEFAKWLEEGKHE